MKAMKSTSLALALALAALCGIRAAAADAGDMWLTTKAKIVLLTTEGLSARGVNVDTVNGVITLHGKVATQAEKDKAATLVQDLDGVKSVKNLLQVVPESATKIVKASDDVIRDRAKAALKGDPNLNGISIASVNNGVVLLSGRATSLNEKLRAIELVSNIDGVTRVASEIETETH